MAPDGGGGPAGGRAASATLDQAAAALWRISTDLGGLRGDAFLTALVCACKRVLDASSCVAAGAAGGWIWRPGAEAATPLDRPASDAPPGEETAQALMQAAPGAVAAAPLRDGDGAALGVLAVARPADLRVAQAVLSALADRAAVELEAMDRAADTALTAARLSAAATMSVEWFWETDAEGRFSYMSEAVTRASGMAPGQFLGLTREQALGPTTVAANQAAFGAIARAMTGRRGFRDIEYRIEEPDGRMRYVRISGAPFTDAQGAFAGYRGVGADLTALREAQEAASRNLQRLTDGVAAMPAGFALFDRSDRLVLCNAAYRDMHRGLGVNVIDIRPGVSFETIARASLTAGIYADPEAAADPEAFLAARMARHRNPDSAPFEQRISNGRWVEIAERRTMDGGVVTVRTDVTARKQAQDLLREAVDTLPVGFLLCGVDDRVVIANQRYRDLYPELADIARPGAHFADLCLACGRLVDADGPRKGQEAWLRERLSNFRNPAAERQVETLAGRTILLSEARTASGVYVAAHVDVTPLVLLQEQLAVQTDRAEAALAARSRFLANISHDLRTPLNAVLGLAELIHSESRGPLPAAYRDYAARIKQSGAFLLSLIVDMLDMSQIEHGAMPLSCEAVDMTALARDGATLIAPVAGRAGARIVVTPSLDACVAWADRRRAQQILHNLLANAVASSADAEIAVSMARRGPMLEVRVADQGAGMSEEQARSALTPFSQSRVASGPGGRDGHGLGLSIVKALVELHGGALAIDSAPGAGATVRFTLPLAAADGAGPLA